MTIKGNPEDIVCIGGSLFNPLKMMSWKEGSIKDCVLEFNNLCCNGELLEPILKHWDEEKASNSVVTIQLNGYLIVIGKVKSYKKIPDKLFI